MYIKSFYISNFRSLVDFNITQFDKTTIFYGENNTGKSNILTALNILFARKRKTIEGNFENFYEGLVENFAHNFYKNQNNDIVFKIELLVEAKGLDVEEELKKNYLRFKENDNLIEFSGSIVSKNGDLNTGEIITDKILFNEAPLYSNDVEKGEILYLSHYTEKAHDQGELSGFFTRLINPLNDCVKIITSNRDMIKSNFINKEITEITPLSFKQFLHSLYLSPERYFIFDKVDKVFNSEPFKFGEISFSRINQKNNSELDIMIKENEIRLPIKHLGSGVLQILYIITNVVYFANKILCIEEPEQNLSPQLQLATMLKLKSLLEKNEISSLKQLIISSHSPTFSKSEMGLVYVLDRQDRKTIVKEKKLKEVEVKDSPELKKLLFDTQLPSDTYTPGEWETKRKENKLREEKMFNR